MTEEEALRVDSIIENPEFDQEDVMDDAGSVFSGPHSVKDGSLRPSSTLTVFYPDESDLETLQTIDRKLQLMTPQESWETRSLIWSSVQPSGIQTPQSRYGGLSRQAYHVQLARGISLQHSLHDKNKLIHGIKKKFKIWRLCCRIWIP